VTVTGCRATVLFTVLARSAAWQRCEFVRCTVKSACTLCVAEGAGTKEELHFTESDMTKPIMPLQQFFLRFCQVVICIVHLIDCCIEGCHCGSCLSGIVGFRGW
jgi:hypothetical protein